MKTEEGIIINFLGDGGVSIRAKWHKNGENVLISGKDFKPEILFNVIYNLRELKNNSNITNIYKK